MVGKGTGSSSVHAEDLLLDGQDQLFFLDDVLEPQLVPLLFLLLEQISQGTVEGVRWLNHRNGSEALVGVFLQQIGFPIHEVVFETFGWLGLDRKQVLAAQLYLFADVQILFNVIKGLIGDLSTVAVVESFLFASTCRNGG